MQRPLTGHSQHLNTQGVLSLQSGPIHGALVSHDLYPVCTLCTVQCLPASAPLPSPLPPSSGIEMPPWATPLCQLDRCHNVSRRRPLFGRLEGMRYLPLKLERTSAGGFCPRTPRGGGLNTP